MPRKNIKPLVDTYLVKNTNLQHRFKLWVLRKTANRMNREEIAAEMGNILYSLDKITIVDHNRAFLVRRLYELSPEDIKEQIVQQEAIKFKKVGKEEYSRQTVLKQYSFRVLAGSTSLLTNYLG